MTSSHAKRELELAGLYDKDSDYGGMLAKAVMELVEVFEKQGHSGSSAHMVADLFNKVALHKLLTPVTGKDHEWVDVGHGAWQNSRCSALFKDEDGRAYYLDAIVWQGEDAFDTFTGSVNGVSSRQYVRFPFIEKTFRINVVRERYDETKHKGRKDIVTCGDGDYVYDIKDPSQLDAVFEYYDRFEFKK